MVPAVILCGGLGTRLRGVLGDRPKCLAPVGDRTYLDFFTDYLYRQGIDDFIFATGHGHAQVEAWLRAERRPWQGTLSREAEPLGTGGALRLAAHRVEGSLFFAFNGDTFLEVDCAGLLARHRAAGSPLTLAAVEVPDTAAFGSLEISEGYVVDFREKGRSGPGFINGGAYVIERDFMAAQPEGYLSLEKDVLMQPGFRPAAFLAHGRFLDIGTPENLAEAGVWAEALTAATPSP
jgi:D-glycero-alpha-D-manno-heptose 1-phosphate guanylyltransferase